MSVKYEMRRDVAAALRALAHRLEPPMPDRGWRCTRCGGLLGHGECHLTAGLWSCAALPQMAQWDDEALLERDRVKW